MWRAGRAPGAVPQWLSRVDGHPVAAAPEDDARQREGCRTGEPVARRPREELRRIGHLHLRNRGRRRHGCRVEAVDAARPMRASAEMLVAQLWRHPVKSFQGEQVVHVFIDPDGIRGDRAWGVRDETTGRILTGRREPRLLQASARLDGDEPSLQLPTGETCLGCGPDTDAALSRWLGADVTLVAAAADPPGSAEYFADATDDTSAPIEWTMPPGRFVDAMPVHVLTTASIAAGHDLHPDGDWDPRRFRSNVLIEADGAAWQEDRWCGHIVRIGEVELDVRQPCIRCTMVTRAQPGLERDLDIYKTVARHHRGHLGVWATVRVPGTVRVGDIVDVIERTDMTG